MSNPVDFSSMRARFAGLGAGAVRLHALAPSAEASVRLRQHQHLPATAATPLRGGGGGDDSEMTRADLIAGNHVLGVRLENPARRNAMSPKMMVELAEIVDDLEARCGDHSAAAFGLVLYGAGGTFCSGFDLSVARESFLTSEAGVEMCLLMQDTLARMRRLPLHTVAAVEGYALGGGAELCMSCDRRIVGQSAAVQFVQGRMGVTPGWGGASWLTQAVGPATALKLLASAERLTAERCVEAGIAEAIAQGPLLADTVDGDAAGDPADAEPALGRNDGPAVRAAADLLHGFHTAGSIAPRILRELKAAVVAASAGGQAGLDGERAVFGRVWGGPANLAALNRGR
ncbi:enoyl CoA hydratase domain-containing protein 1 [Polyrhizophydium stewartii]|uniref:Enoyl CoA hydratase domain-containing protein 1 n=1 Tax=Polyrhizophydium stewartii TaxID=2732419 RepID=A0ABR4NIN1_9FUNG